MRRAALLLFLCGLAMAASPAQTPTPKTGARELIILPIGDTLTPGYSFRTDSALVLTNGGKSLVAVKCGTSVVFLRGYKGASNAPSAPQKSADSVAVIVPCPASSVTPAPSPAPTPTPTDSLAEPVFDATKSTMLLAQNFDAYTADSLHPPCRKSVGGARLGEPSTQIIDHSWGYCGTFGDSLSVAGGVDNGVRIVPGHSGNGVAFHYDGAFQESHGLVTTAAAFKPTGTATVFLQYWAKWTSDSAGMFATTYDGVHGSAIAQIKNVMLWHGNNRLQFDTHGHDGNCPIYGPSFSMIAVLDMADIFCSSDSPVGPYMIDFADGQWHRWTIQFKANSATGARDGLARLWIDGKLTNNLERGACGVTPPGGWKPWCDVSELDGLTTSTNGINQLEWGGPLTAGSFGFSIAIDDVAWWRLK